MMRRNIVRQGGWIGLVLLLAGSVWPVTEAMGQRRGGGGYSYDRDRDYGSSVNEFRANSFGLGNLPGQQPAGGGGALGSSIYGKTPETVRPPMGVNTLQTNAPFAGDTTRSYRVYQPQTLSVQQITGGASPVISPGYDPNQIQAFLDVREKARQEVLANPENPILSFVPDLPGRYHDLMADGERAFRNGAYQQALNDFFAATQVSRSQTPGALLSLSRAYVAGDNPSYSSAAMYLSWALQMEPMIPLVNIRPQTFYGNSDDYDRDMARMDTYVKENPNDAEALLVLAYWKWRADQAEQAAGLLAEAQRKAVKQDTVQGVALLMKAMESSGKIKSFRSELKMADAVDYPTGGIELAIPEGFTLNPLREGTSLLQAVAGQGDDARSLSVMAFPVSKEITAKAFLDAAMEHLKNNTAIENLRVRSESELSFNEIDGYFRVISYTHSNVPSAATGACFIRDRKDSEEQNLAYLVVIEAPQMHVEDLGKMLASVLQTVKYTPIRRPSDLPLDTEGMVFTDEALGFSVIQPGGWALQQTSNGLLMGQVDYALGGVACPEVHVVATMLDKPMTVQEIFKAAVEKSTPEGIQVEVVSHGSTKLADREAYQCIFRKVASPAATQPAQKYTENVELVRLITLPEQDGKTPLYIVAMECYDTDLQKCVSLMDQVSAGFKLLSDHP